MLIGSIRQVPKSMLDNEYIHNGYRIGFNTTCEAFKSLFMLHNESVNVWSHLVGVLIFVGLIVYTIIQLGPRVQYDIHFQIMEKFEYLSSLAEEAYNCDYSQLNNATHELFNIYQEDINKLSTQCELEPTFFEKDDLQTMIKINIEEVKELSYKQQFEENLEVLLDRIETYFYSMVNGMNTLSQKIKCPEKIEELIINAKNMTARIQESFRNYTQNIKYDDLNFEHIKRVVSIEAISDKVSNIFHQMIEDQRNSKMPDISFSSYFEYPGEILHEVSKIPLLIHMVTAIMCLS